MSKFIYFTEETEDKNIKGIELLSVNILRNKIHVKYNDTIKQYWFGNFSINGLYKHFKNKFYYVIGQTVIDDILYVMYVSLYDDKVWIRPKDMFESKVDKEKYPNVKQEYRFDKIANADDNDHSYITKLLNI